MPLRVIVFAELRKNGMRAGHLWKIQQWLALRNRLDYSSFSDFDNTLNNLCNEGIVKEERISNAVNYRLTEKGEAMLYYR